MRNGAVINGSSSFASPVSVTKKSNGEYRFCVDYRKLNAQTKDINFPIPRIDSLQFLLTSENYWFSTVDLKSAYYSLPLTKSATEKAAIITHSGVFKPLRCPFGLKNAPAKFSELVAAVVQGLEGSIFAYLDDFLIFSKTLKEHLSHLDNILSRLSSFGFFLNREKCRLGKNSVDFLGYENSQNGMRPLAKKVEFISLLKPPKTVRDVRSFIGLVNYYKSFCENFSALTAPFNSLLKESNKKQKRSRFYGTKLFKSLLIKF